MDTSATFWLPPPSSTMAAETDALFYFILYTAIFFFVLIVSLALYFTIKYRVKPGESAAPDPTAPTHNPLLEASWIVIPTILVMVVFGWGFHGFLKSSIVPANALQIKVTGQKWFWGFDYAEGASTVNEMVAPVDTPIKLLMSSKDVIHSFFVPAFRLKHDVLPNRYRIGWFQATQPGTYDLYCAEFCGSKHSQMIGKVRIVSEREYKEWLDEASDLGKGLTPAEFGRKLFTNKACNTCHTLDGTPSNGPSLKGVFGHDVKLASGATLKADENYIRKSILDPASDVVAGYQPIMPTFQGLLKDKELDALVAFIQTLGVSK